MYMEPNSPAPIDSNTPPVTPDPAPAPAPAEPVVPAPADLAPAPAPKDPVSQLQSERDKLKHQLSTIEQFLEPIAVERAADKFLADNKDAYPDLEADDFRDVAGVDADSMKEHADRLQDRLKRHAQKKVMEIENPQTPVISVEEREQQLTSLRTSKDPGRFGKFLNLQRAASSR